MNYRLSMTIALAMLGSSPVLAQNNVAAPTNTAEATPPDTAAGNVANNVAVTAPPADNAGTAAPAETAAAEPASTTAPQPERTSFPWGVLGLLGLIGLLGSRKSAG